MSRYIDADKIVQIIEERMNDIASTYGENDEYVQAMDECITKIEDVPTADIKEVIYGKWIWDDFLWRCSICNVMQDYRYNFCPHCGAELRGKHGGK